MSIKELKKMKKELSVFKVEDKTISKEIIDKMIENVSAETREDTLNNYIGGILHFDRLELKTIEELLKSNEW